MCMWKPEKFKYFSSDVIQYLCATVFHCSGNQQVTLAVWPAAPDIYISLYLQKSDFSLQHG